jgi:predicted amidophosphoribosyltransferase
MPTFKHPCPYCDKMIDRAVAACPYCGQADPFAPKRCQNCRKIIEDPAWILCPSCGASLIAPPPGTVPATQGKQGKNAPPVQPPPPPRPPLFSERNSAAGPSAAPATATPAAGGKCSGCGAPLPAGARFCTVCGTTAG